METVHFQSKSFSFWNMLVSLLTRNFYFKDEYSSFSFTIT